ncbi:MAG: serine/threonine-protein phosphatase [Clostridiales bacterium]|nr:serine/threonine-protein phosphatase [Clostridiales bacterium]
MNYIQKPSAGDAAAPAPQQGHACGTLLNIGSRPDQQDSIAVSDLNDEELCAHRGVLLTLADGMGGLANGGAVSRLLVDTLQRSFVQRPMDTDPAPWLLELLGDANRQVNQLLEGKEPSGSTLVMALVQGDRLYHLSVGDSRLYLSRGEGLILLNREQTYGRKLDLTLLKEILPASAVASHPQRRSLTNYVGMGDLEEVDRNTIPVTLLPGDTVLLLSDGVFNTLTEAEIVSALRSNPDTAAIRLERMVLERHKPYQDNFSGILYRYGQ